MRPVALATVPRPTAVVAVPVIADAERHDADSQTRAELKDGYAAVLIIVIEVIAVDPSAIAFPIHVAPRPVIETAVYIEKAIRWYG
jgi:hypothetical protein